LNNIAPAHVSRLHNLRNIPFDISDFYLKTLSSQRFCTIDGENEAAKATAAANADHLKPESIFLIL
jgi:hypothetical protein